MGALIEVAAVTLGQSTRRVEIAAQNVANLTTAGYKRRVAFMAALGEAGAPSGAVEQSTDFAQGKLQATGNPLDFAILGDGFFTVRDGERLLYTRQGQFERRADGRLATPQGFVLQGVSGDLVVPGEEFTLTSDGAVLIDGEVVDKIGLVDFADRSALVPGEGSTFAAAGQAPVDVQRQTIRQGAVEASNVSTAQEMIEVMEALRRAETGQRLVNVYDDLLGRALNSFGQF